MNGEVSDLLTVTIVRIFKSHLRILAIYVLVFRRLNAVEGFTLLRDA
jgi:hypothetical protein